jgi:hypothetical protein
MSESMSEPCGQPLKLSGEMAKGSGNVAVESGNVANHPAEAANDPAEAASDPAQNWAWWSVVEMTEAEAEAVMVSMGST